MIEFNGKNEHYTKPNRGKAKKKKNKNKDEIVLNVSDILDKLKRNEIF